MKNSQQSGFTLVEILISAFILTVAVGSVMALIMTNLQAISGTKRSVVAANLAQEGVEIVRALRDTNWIENLPYDAGNIGINGTYCANYNSLILMNPCPDLQYKLYWNSTDRVYTHISAGNSATPYEREIRITRIPNPEDPDPQGDDPDVLQVESVVRYQVRDVTRSIIVEDHLYDWR